MRLQNKQKLILIFIVCQIVVSSVAIWAFRPKYDFATRITEIVLTPRKSGDRVAFIRVDCKFEIWNRYDANITLSFPTYPVDLKGKIKLNYDVYFDFGNSPLVPIVFPLQLSPGINVFAVECYLSIPYVYYDLPDSKYVFSIKISECYPYSFKNYKTAVYVRHNTIKRMVLPIVPFNWGKTDCRIVSFKQVLFLLGLVAEIVVLMVLVIKKRLLLNYQI